MKLYVLSSGMKGYDVFTQILVSAPDEETAKDLNPYGESYKKKNSEEKHFSLIYPDRFMWNRMWANDPSLVKAVEIGISHSSKIEVLMTSFYAG